MGQRDLKRLLITGAMAVSAGPSGAARRRIPGWTGRPVVARSRDRGQGTYPPPRCKEELVHEELRSVKPSVSMNFAREEGAVPIRQQVHHLVKREEGIAFPSE